MTSWSSGIYCINYQQKKEVIMFLVFGMPYFKFKLSAIKIARKDVASNVAIEVTIFMNVLKILSRS